MIPIPEITGVLKGAMTAPNIRIFSELIAAFFSARHKITTRSLSRYTDYSLRQLFRFLKKDIDWLAVRVLLFKNFIFSEEKAYILAVDETVEGKAGKESWGLGNFYSSSAQKSIKSVCFFNLSLIDTGTKTSYMMHTKQVVYSEEDLARAAALKKKAAEGKKRAAAGAALPKGRKKGVKNKAGKPADPPSASLRAFTCLWRGAVSALKNLPGIKISHLVADSAYGTAPYLALCAAAGYKMVSKLKSNAALYAPPADPSGKPGRPPSYGKKIDVSSLDKKHLKKSCTENGIKTEYYGFEAYSKAIKGVCLNIVVLIKTLPCGKKSTNIFFSDDLSISFETLILYYSMRFQIEFDFRDAKQHFGMSDFKNYKEKNLGNFVEMSFTMTLIGQIMIASRRASAPGRQTSLADLKTVFNARYQAKNIIKSLPLDLQNHFNSQWIDQYMPQDLIHAA